MCPFAYSRINIYRDGYTVVKLPGDDDDVNLGNIITGKRIKIVE